jgi:hypothetical protein
MQMNLETCSAAILKDPLLPTFSSQIPELLAIGAEDHTAQRRAALVSQDYALTLRVLQVANSFQYNRSSRPVDNIARAIIMMGVVELRSLASSLLLFDEFTKRSEPLRRLMLLSMLTAMHARGTAESDGSNRLDEVYLLGMLRNLGEVLVACHWPEVYPTIGDDPPGAVPGFQAVRVLGFSYETLAREVGEHWHFPSQVMALWSKTGAIDAMTAAIQFGHDVTTVMYRRPGADVWTKLRLLRMQYGRRFDLTEDDIQDIADTAAETLEPTLTRLGLTLDDLRADPASTRAIA